MLRAADGIELIKVHQQIVRQRHLLIKLIRKVQVIQIILAQRWWQQPMEIGGLATALSTNQRRHALIAVKLVHLKPVGHDGAQPDGQKPLLFRSDARQAVEELGDMVLSVPFGQIRQIVADGIISLHILRMHKLHDLRLRTAFLAHLLLLGLQKVGNFAKNS